MQDSARPKWSVFPAISVRALLGVAALVSVVAAVAAGGLRGNLFGMAVAVAVVLLSAVFVLYALAALVLFAAALVLARRVWETPGPFRPVRPEAPLPHDLEGQER